MDNLENFNLMEGFTFHKVNNNNFYNNDSLGSVNILEDRRFIEFSDFNTEALNTKISSKKNSLIN